MALTSPRNLVYVLGIDLLLVAFGIVSLCFSNYEKIKILENLNLFFQISYIRNPELITRIKLMKYIFILISSHAIRF